MARDWLQKLPSVTRNLECALRRFGKKCVVTGNASDLPISVDTFSRYRHGRRIGNIATSGSGSLDRAMHSLRWSPRSLRKRFFRRRCGA
ncbi:uncharacterized protein LOC127011035 isoform X3 [Drosophila biarmipes]|uniref:uncharacterized protein LOC127011035 isoform X3 n=1 Tax=Drosophila biarmipes TaxID=125945 RepID=UPI0021CCD497|nr:uncharacterized protein LOC127011035 isoform X3 [Drosophila biarmipes]